MDTDEENKQAVEKDFWAAKRAYIIVFRAGTLQKSVAVDAAWKLYFRPRE